MGLLSRRQSSEKGPSSRSSVTSARETSEPSTMRTVWRKLWSKVGSGDDITPSAAETSPVSAISAPSEQPARRAPLCRNGKQPPIRPERSVGDLLSEMLKQNEAASVQGGQNGGAVSSKQSYDQPSDDDKVAMLEDQMRLTQ